MLNYIFNETTHYILRLPVELKKYSTEGTMKSLFEQTYVQVLIEQVVKNATKILFDSLISYTSESFQIRTKVRKATKNLLNIYEEDENLPKL